MSGDLEKELETQEQKRKDIERARKITLAEKAAAQEPPADVVKTEQQFIEELGKARATLALLTTQQQERLAVVTALKTEWDEYLKNGAVLLEKETELLGLIKKHLSTA